MIHITMKESRKYNDKISHHIKISIHLHINPPITMKHFPYLRNADIVGCLGQIGIIILTCKSRYYPSTPTLQEKLELGGGGLLNPDLWYK